MNIKPAGKIVVLILLIGGAYFLIRPMVGKKKPVSTETETEIKADSVASAKESTMVVPQNLRPVVKPSVIKKQVKTEAQVKTEPKKEVSKPKKKGERENLDINF